jgi:endonuclease/exonuclease/phosphatase family metal-dependent hydrolase
LKNTFVRRLLHNNDIVCVQETHSAIDTAAAFDKDIICTHKSYWSHISQRVGGIGVLVKHELIAKHFHSCTWLVHEISRLGSLTLEGPKGSLVLLVVYNDADSSPARIRTMKLAKSICKPSQTCWTIMLGDFNYVEGQFDRYDLYNSCFTGHSDSAEADHIADAVLRPTNLVAFNTPAFTRKHGQTMSRIDRIYSNHPSTLNLVFDNHVHVHACTHCESDHAAVVFRRRFVGKSRGTCLVPAIPAWITKDSSWPTLVEKYYSKHMVSITPVNVWHNLSILKQAVRCTFQHLRSANTFREFSNPSDKVSIGVRLLRSFLSGNYHDVAMLLDTYSDLRQFISKQGYSYIWQDREGLHTFIAEQCFADAASQLQHMDATCTHTPEHVTTAAREHICRKLKKICPGSTSALSAMLTTPENLVITADTDICEELNRYWGGFSKERGGT